MDIPALFEKMLSLFCVLVAGFVCGKLGVMTEDTNRHLSRLVANLTNPMLMLSSVMTGERLMTNGEVLELTLVAAGCYAFLIATSFAVPKLLRVAPGEKGLYRFMYIFSNLGYLGYPIVRALFGAGAMFHMTIFVLVFQFVCWSYGAQIVGGGGRFRLSWSLLKRPSIAGALLAYGIYLSGIQFPAIVADVTSTVGEVTSPLAMLIIGCALAQCPLKAVFGRWQVYALAAVKMLLVPTAAFFALRPFLRSELLLGVTVVALAMPVATNATILSYEYHADEKLAASGVFLTTLLSVVTLPALMLALFGG